MALSSFQKKFTIKSTEESDSNDIMICDDDMLSQLLQIKQDYYIVLKCANKALMFIHLE